MTQQIVETDWRANDFHAMSNQSDCGSSRIEIPDPAAIDVQSEEECSGLKRSNQVHCVVFEFHGTSFRGFASTVRLANPAPVYRTFAPEPLAKS